MKIERYRAAFDHMATIFPMTGESAKMAIRPAIAYVMAEDDEIKGREMSQLLDYMERKTGGERNAEAERNGSGKAE